MYEQKLALGFGFQKGYAYTQQWFELIKNSFQLSSEFADFSYRYSLLKSFAGKLEVNVHKLDQHMLDNESRWRSLPATLPTRGWITSYFGPRVSPIDKRMKMHEGIDIGAVPGTPILAPADGVATYIGDKPGFGKFIQINHGYGIETLYAHAKRLHIKKGALVKRGDVIATIGNTGASTGPHVHYEIRVNGTPVNPLHYVLN